MPVFFTFLNIKIWSGSCNQVVALGTGTDLGSAGP